MPEVRKVGRHASPIFGGLKLGKVLFSGLPNFSVSCQVVQTFQHCWGDGG